VIHEEQGVAMEEDGGHTLINKRPNLVLQYIEHDKPEVLRKEITFEELQQYGFCLFTALAHLHKQVMLLPYSHLFLILLILQ
jgi:hypothetical protein